MDQDLPFKLALSGIQGIGAATFKQLIGYEGSARSIFEKESHKLHRIPGIGPKTSQLIKSISNPGKQGEKVIRDIESLGARILYCKDDTYPQRLLECPDAPAFLFLKGDLQLNQKKVISVVGTRKPSPYGIRMVEEFISGWKSHQPLIISGLAYGIDIKAHRVSLANGLPTLGVIASGLDHLYPRDHFSVAKAMMENGGLLTEYAPGTRPEAARFPARNRLIAGLSDATVVVEAAERGGALITAEMALGYNREVFAIPGRLNDYYSAGCNNLIRSQKAMPLIEPEDLSKNLNWDNALQNGKKAKKPAELLSQIALNDQEKAIIELLSKSDYLQVEDLSWETDIRIPQLATLLLELELKGLIRNFPGNRYSLTI